jgi:excisionase family DNA binding protein
MWRCANIIGSADTFRRMADIGSSDIDRIDQSSSLLTVAEVAHRYRTSPRTVQRWIRDGQLRATRLPGGRGRYRISESDLAAAIEVSA